MTSLFIIFPLCLRESYDAWGHEAKTIDKVSGCYVDCFANKFFKNLNMFVLCRCVGLQPLWDFLHVFDKIQLVYMGLPMQCGLQVLSSVRVKWLRK